ncbi:MAG: lysophospholipid acyltransferase family protein [Candidatus Zixiibacteriota bacterium]
MKRKRIRHRLEYWLTMSISFFARLLPYRFALFLGEIIGDIAFGVVRFRRRVALKNLSRCFKDKNIGELKKIAKGSYRNLGKSLIEYTLFPKLVRKKLSDLVEFDHAEYFEQALKGGKGAVLLTGHFGSWELMAAAVSQMGYPVDLLVGEQHNLLMDRLMNNYRMSMGVGIIKVGTSAKGVIKALRNNRFVAMLSDQDAGKDGVLVDFFNYPTSTPKGPAAFVLRTQVPIIMGFIIRNNRKKQKVLLRIFRPSLNSDNKEQDIKKLTQKYTSILESYIRKYPDHWYWIHRRWKSTLPPWKKY